MIKEYTYRLPLSYIFIGCIAICLAILFGNMIHSETIWVSLLSSVLMIITCVTGILFLYTTLANVTISTLKISRQHIELPTRSNKHIQVSFDGIYNVHIASTNHGKLIEIYTKNGNVFIIDQKWMKKKDFIEVSNRLNEWK